MKRDDSRDLLGAYRVLDLTDEKGFLCGKVLGDLGAEVIKVERPGGDPGRRIAPFYHDSEEGPSLFWLAYNTSKRGITLDIETREGRELFERLVRSADCLVESFPVGHLEGLGLGWSRLSVVNPQLVMTSITPFGQGGPWRDYKIADLTAQALSGLMYTTGFNGKAPYQMTNAETRQAYLQAGLHAAVATVLALYHRPAAARGQHVDVSIAESMIAGTDAIQFVLDWELEKRLTVRNGNLIVRDGIAYNNIYRCRDGYITARVFVGTQARLFQPLVAWMESLHMAEDLAAVEWDKLQRLDLTQEQVDHWEAVVSKFLLTRTKKEVEQEAVKRGFIAFPVNEAKDLLDDRQLEYREFFVPVDHPELGTRLTYPGAAYKSSCCETGLRGRAPLAGEHNDEVYRDLGLSGEEVEALSQKGII